MNRIIALGVIAGVLAACSDPAPPVTTTSPLRFSPDRVAIDDALVGLKRDFPIKVSNTSGSPVRFTRPPTLTEGTEDSRTELAIVQALAQDCDGAPTASALEIPANGCSVLVIRYIAAQEGRDTAKVRFDLEGAAAIELDVTANAHEPNLFVCAYDGSVKLGCNATGQPLDLDFGMHRPGETVTRTLKLTQGAALSVTVSRLQLAGDAAFEVDPASYSGTLAFGDEVPFTVRFTPDAVGSFESTLTFETNPVLPSPVSVRMRGEASDQPDGGSGGSDGGDSEGDGGTGLPDGGDGEGDGGTVLPDGGTVLPDGGTVLPDGGTVLPDGGTVLPDGGVSVTDGGDQTGDGGGETFPDGGSSDPTDGGDVLPDGGSVLPDGGIAYGDGGTTLPDGGSAEPDGGQPIGCRLETGFELDFQTVELGKTATLPLELTNTGDETCNGPFTPAITFGPAHTFYPSMPQGSIAPGQSLSGSVEFIPRGGLGVFSGTLKVSYAGGVGGTAAQSLSVELRGHAPHVPGCTLMVTPFASSMMAGQIAFGQVPLAQPVRQTLRLEPTPGSGTCTISSVSLVEGVAGDKSPFRIIRQPASIVQSGSSTEIEIEFWSDQAKTYGSSDPAAANSVSLLLETNDTLFDGMLCGAAMGAAIPPPPGCAAFALTATAGTPTLELSTTEIDFKGVAIGCRSEERTITLRNTGSASVTLSSVSVSSSASEFQLTPGATTIAAGQSTEIKVRYAPYLERASSGQLRIQPSGNVPPLIVNLRGQGESTATRAETFPVVGTNKIDVLFVVDTSNRMGDEQLALATNLSQFLAVAQAANTDYQAGVVTMDMLAPALSGRLQGTPRFVTRNTFNGTTLLANAIKAGTSSMAPLQGFAAMLAALTPPLISDVNANRGFLRRDADLAVIILSSRDDASSLAVGTVVDFLQRQKLPPHRATLHAIVSNQQVGCGLSDEDGTRYLAARAQTGGAFVSVCTSNWPGEVAKLGEMVFGPPNFFRLARTPAQVYAMEVSVDGQVLPTGGMQSWQYLADSNAISMSPSMVPQAGSVVSVSYPDVCYPWP